MFSADVRNYEEVAKAIEETTNSFGPIDTVIAGDAGNFVANAQTISLMGSEVYLK